MDLSFHNKYSFFQKIDALPQGPGWSCQSWEVLGDMVDDKGQHMGETIELWKRDPVECIKELMGNPTFKDHIKYAPEQHFTSSTCSSRVFDEMSTGEWWWEIQVRTCCPS